MKIKYAYFFLISAVIFSLALTAFKFNDGTQENEQNDKVIKFSHQKHSDASCTDCHSSVAENTALPDAELPKKESCASCHDVEDADNCSQCHYDDVYVPLQKKRSSLIFNHRFHLQDLKNECIECHKGIETVDYSFQAVSYKPPMEKCYGCHSESKVATNVCEACHISTNNLIPESHNVSNYSKFHKFQAEKTDANCIMCHDNNSCQSCHAATNVMTEVNLANDFYKPYETFSIIDGSKIQKISRVHDLNFRFTHGMDLKGKTSECTTCHQTETFCVTCHASNSNDFAMSGIMPSTHKNNDFLTFGVGSGGGAHAKLAKRDIERCASCHDLNGNDPACVMCHYDNDGIKGTNPKTHTSGYMKSEKGDWHFDDSSICYNCHTDSGSRFRVKGTGFCSYCHQ